MDGLCRVLAAGMPWEHGRRSYWITPLTLGVLAEAEQLLLYERSDLYELLRQRRRLGPLAFAAVEKLACDEARADRKLRSLPRDEVEHWLLWTADGTTFAAWRCLHAHARTRGGALTRARARRLVLSLSPDDLDELRLRIRHVSGLDLLSVLDAPSMETPGVMPGRTAKVKERAAKAAAKNKDKPFPARRICRLLAENYGWGPEIVAGLTLFQVRLYLAPSGDGGGGGQTSMVAAKELFGKMPPAAARRLNAALAGEGGGDGR